MRKWIVLGCTVLLPVFGLSAQTLQLVYAFTNGPASPVAGLALGPDGNLYGTTEYGGISNAGTIFCVSTNGAFNTLVSFTNGNGANPVAGLALGPDGNFYGTTSYGGTNNGNQGTVFRVTTNGMLTTLDNFGYTGEGGYFLPLAGLLWGPDGNFYGTTFLDRGSIFQVTTNGVLSILVSLMFGEGFRPAAGLVLGPDGNLYGTTAGGGTNVNDVGTVFRVNTNGTFATVVNFTNGNGADPVASLAVGPDGKLYGTTQQGGTNHNAGTIFRVTTNGVFARLFNFDGLYDGGAPSAALTPGPDGNLYGVASTGGSSSNGTAFMIATNGAFVRLAQFGGGVGTVPLAPLLLGPDGNFYGTCSQGGAGGNGTIFRLVMPVSVISLGTTNLTEGPAAGYDTVVLSSTFLEAWTAVANASWLHLSVANQSGRGNAVVSFTFDANFGSTRVGSLTIGGQTVIVTQAGATYVSAPAPVTTLAASGLNAPSGMVLDGSGNLYFSDSGNNAIKEWVASANMVQTIIASGLNAPDGLAMDAAGNLYIADAGNNEVKLWNPASNTVSVLVSTGLDSPAGLAVDPSGNVYIADQLNNAIKEWSPANNTVVTLFTNGLIRPSGAALDAAGKLYIADQTDDTLKVWNPADGSVTLLYDGLFEPEGVTVDGSGNVYVAVNSAIVEWSPITKNLVNLVPSGLNHPNGVAVDAMGDVFMADADNNALKELPRVFVDPTPRTEDFGAGSGVLPSVLPAGENFLPPFVPVTDQPWLTVNSISSGVIGFGFTATTTNRTGDIIVFGQDIAVSQVINSFNGIVSNGSAVFSFTNYVSGASYDVLSATNITTPLSSWIPVATSSNLPVGDVQFAIPLNPNDSQSFYRLQLLP